MTAPDDDHTASLMTPAKLAQLKVRPTQAASPSAWLDQMAADAGSGHVRRLLDLRQQLEAAMRGREGDFRTLATACQSLHGALEQLDVDQVQPRGWLAKAAGKGKEAVAAFASRHHRIERAAEDISDGLRGLQKRQVAQGSALDRLMLEVGAELGALEKIMDQGARWLQDMRGQLKARTAQGGDAEVQAQIRQDTARCELLVERLKLLRTCASATQPALEHCKAANSRRASVAGSLQQLLDEEWKVAEGRFAKVLRQVEEEGAAKEGLEKAGRAREALQSALAQAVQDCGSLQATEQAAADELAALQVPLQSAA